ncbi:S-phase kinase-associated protein 2-like isoform X1 [Schistocerca serialis cubense]|uniref:S-phase kinase-associated protein 2-like isoform X1 n=1 Tax=Schistocerca serialis cubense TaxID=2023355 RepID=UPI00214E3C98|nr:S-phase kinase-associated protein 2-like isoform X1 [Schistocerca serialis cubense]
MKTAKRMVKVTSSRLVRGRRAKLLAIRSLESKVTCVEKRKVEPPVNKDDVHNVTINDLPDELLLNVMKFLSVEELLIAQEVCHRWEQLTYGPSVWLNKSFVVWHGRHAVPLARGDRIGRYCSVETSLTSWSKADIFLRTQSPKYLNKILKRMPHLRVCALPFERQAIEALSTYCQNITKLEIITCSEVDTITLTNLVERCPLIEVLKLPVSFMTTECLAELIAHLKYLQALSLHVDISNWYSQPVVLQPLARNCSRLCKLNLWCFTLSDIGYLFKAQPPLEELSLRWTTEEKRCVLPDLLACWKSVKFLQLQEYNVRHEESFQAFRSLGELSRLNWLEIQCVKECPEGAIGEAFRYGGLSQLQHVDLSNSWALDDIGLISLIHGCPQVRWLRLFGCYGLTDEAFKDIYKLVHLKRLNISRCVGLGSAAMFFIARVPKLRTLWVEYTDFRRLRPGIKCIIDLPELRHLHMGMTTNLQYVPFDSFPENLSNLKSLDVQCSKFDAAVMENLKKRMPSLKVHVTQFQYQDINSADTSDDEV